MRDVRAADERVVGRLIVRGQQGRDSVRVRVRALVARRGRLVACIVRRGCGVGVARGGLLGLAWRLSGRRVVVARRGVGVLVAIVQRRYAEIFGVSEAQIYKDMDRIAEFVRENLDTGICFSLYSLRHRVVSDLLAADSWRASVKAFDLELRYAEWVGVAPADEDDDRDADGPVAGESDDFDPDSKAPTHCPRNPNATSTL